MGFNNRLREIKGILYNEEKKRWMLFIEQILLIHQPDIISFWDSYRIVTTIYSDVEVIYS
jgi:hypothetical protein